MAVPGWLLQVGCACLAGWSGDSWPSPQMMALWQKVASEISEIRAKVPLGIYQETSSRGGEASQVLWVVPVWQEGGGW